MYENQSRFTVVSTMVGYTKAKTNEFLILQSKPMHTVTSI